VSSSDFPFDLVLFRFVFAPPEDEGFRSSLSISEKAVTAQYDSQMLPTPTPMSWAFVFDVVRVDSSTLMNVFVLYVERFIVEYRGDAVKNKKGYEGLQNFAPSTGDRRPVGMVHTAPHLVEPIPSHSKFIRCTHTP
jgi:hypothetical protein